MPFVYINIICLDVQTGFIPIVIKITVESVHFDFTDSTVKQPVTLIKLSPGYTCICMSCIGFPHVSARSLLKG